MTGDPSPASPPDELDAVLAAERRAAALIEAARAEAARGVEAAARAAAEADAKLAAEIAETEAALARRIEAALAERLAALEREVRREIDRYEGVTGPQLEELATWLVARAVQGGAGPGRP